MENQSSIRNFSIISHIDHGKSTLADRFLELTETIPKEKMRTQYLDIMDLEREKGITIKMQSVRMEFGDYILNLIDTPGHVDFSYEVSRSLAAVEGAILLVDATKGIQAQTLANLELAKKQNLVIIPVVNKIDLPQARIEETKTDLAHLLNIPAKDVFLVSAKYGTNVEQLLEAVIKKIPRPEGNPQKPLKALIFDSKYDSYKGVIVYIRIIDGEIKSGETIYLLATKTKGKIKEIGFFKPELLPQSKLNTGEIGYIATGIKEPEKVRVGDTITILTPSLNLSPEPEAIEIEPLPGYQEPKPMVFAGIYPEDTDDFDLLKKALTELKLNDASLTFKPETREFLGRGFLCGFLGTLHGEIVSERLRREFGLNLIISTPQVVYKIVDKQEKERIIFAAQDFPDLSEIEGIQEPWVKLEVMTPQNFFGQVLKLLEQLSGEYVETQYFGADRALLVYKVPFREVIVGFYDKLKGATQGFASMNYEFLGYKIANLVKLEILVAGEKEEAFSRIVPEERGYLEGKEILRKIKEVLPPQLFSVPLQAQIRGRIIARETIKAKRRDVTASLYGGDYTRKRKLLEKQKKGKKKLKAKARLHIPPKVFLEIFKIR